MYSFSSGWTRKFQSLLESSLRSSLARHVMPTRLLRLCLAIAPLEIASAQRVENTAKAEAMVAAEPNVILRVLVSAAYDDSPRNLAMIRTVTQSLPPLLDSTTVPQPVDVLVWEWYNVGVGPKSRASGDTLPQTYAYLAAYIRQLNGVPLDAAVIPAGQVLMPALPKRALTEPNDTLGRNYVPQVLRSAVRLREHENTKPLEIPPAVVLTTTADSSLHTDTVRRLVLGRGFRLVTGADRPASQYRALELVVPLRLAPALNVRAKALIDSGLATFTSLPVRIRTGQPTDSIADSTGDSTPSVVRPAAANLGASASGYAPWWGPPTDSISHAIGAVSRRRTVPMAVVDFGWPSDADYQYSRNRLRELVDLTRKDWGLSPLNGRVKDPSFTPPSHKHSVHIANAISALRNVMQPSPVDVLFVPLTQEQDAGPILKELIRTSYGLRLKFEGLRLAALDDTKAAVLASCEFDPSDFRSFPRCARALSLGGDDTDDVLRQVDRDLSLIPLQVRTDAAGRADVRTSSSILSAVWRVLDAYSLARDTTAVVSVSWTVEQLFGISSLPESRWGPSPVVLVAAVGNVPGFLVNGVINAMDFGASANDPHVLAVLDVDTSGAPRPYSSLVDSTAHRLARINAVGYDGVVSDSVYGTSFAAPRVAWFLAAGEAIRAKRRSDGGWALDLMGRITCLRSSQGLRGLRLRPIDFLMTPVPSCPRVDP
jgi:hypothetical protein